MDSILNVHSSFRQDLILNDQAGFLCYILTMQTCLWLQLCLDLFNKYTMVCILICLIYGSFKENPFLRCYLCWCKACKHFPSIWYVLLVFPGRPCLSISCLFNLQPPTWEGVWCNNGSDGNMIIECTLITIWEGLEIIFSTFFFRIVMALCCMLLM